VSEVLQLRRVAIRLQRPARSLQRRCGARALAFDVLCALKHVMLDSHANAPLRLQERGSSRVFETFRAHALIHSSLTRTIGHQGERPSEAAACGHNGMVFFCTQRFARAIPF